MNDSKSTDLATSKFGNIGSPAWSPDGKWLAYSKADATRNTDIYLLPSAGGKEEMGEIQLEEMPDAGPKAEEETPF